MNRRDFLKTLSVVAAAALLPMDAFSFEVDTGLIAFDEELFNSNDPQVIMIFLTGGPSELGANLSNIDEIDALSIYKHNISSSERTPNNFWVSAGGSAMERMLASGDMNLFRTCFRKDNPIRSHGFNTWENMRAICGSEDIKRHPSMFATVAKVLADRGLVTPNSLMPFVELNGDSGFFTEGDYFTQDSAYKPIAIMTDLSNPFTQKETTGIDTDEAKNLDALANSMNQPDAFGIAIDKSVSAGAFVEMIKAQEVPADAGYSGSSFSKGLQLATTIMINNPDTRIVTLGGAGLGRWDDHSYSRTTYLPRMKDLMESIESSLNHMRIVNRDNIAIVVFGEFGRNVNLNAANGWDHGNNQNVFLFGGRRFFNHVGIVGETVPFGDAADNRLYLEPAEGSYWFEPYAVGATLYKVFGITNPEVLTGGYREIEAGLLKCNDDSSIDETLIATRISSYELSADATTNVTLLHQAIADTPEGKILYLDVAGAYPIDTHITVDRAIRVVVKPGINFTLQLTQSAARVLFVNTEGVTISGLGIDGNNQTNVGIYSNYGNLEISKCKVYNILYNNPDIADVAWGIGVVPQLDSSDSGNITISENEIYNVENTLYDDRRGTYGLARGIHLNYQHLDGKVLSVNILGNKIHDIIAEEDDHISIAHDGSAGDTAYPHTTLIQDNRFVGFTRRAVKMMIPNATVERNYCESASDFDTTLHPPYTGIDIMGANSTVRANTVILSKEFNTAIMASQVNAMISDNQVKLYGGVSEQYLCHVAYNALDYQVKNNTFEMIDSLYNAYMYYIKGNTRGMILDNYHKITTPQAGKIEAFVFQTVWKETVISNDMIYQGKRYSGDVEYAVYYSGKSSENIEMTEIYQGEYVRTIFEGDMNSSAITLKESGWDMSDVM